MDSAWTSPFNQQYFEYMSGVFHGDFGVSATNKVSVATSFMTRFPATIELAVSAMIIAIGVGIPLGVAAAKRQYSLFDNFATVASLIGISIPIFSGPAAPVRLRRLASLVADRRAV